MAPKKDKESVPQIKGDEAEAAILAYLKAQNRPYNAVDVSLNMKTVSKTVTTKALTALAERGDITVKMYGKQAIYISKQELAKDDDNESLKQIQAETNEAIQKIKELKDANKMLTMRVEENASQPKTTELPAMIESLVVENEKLNARVAAMTSGDQTSVISTASVENQAAIYRETWKMWQSRRAVFRNMLDAVSGDMSISQRQSFLEDLIGDPTDESEEVKAFEIREKAKLQAPANKRRRVG